MENDKLFPVTGETFSQCWNYVDNLRRNAQRKAAVAKVGGFLTNFFFLFFLLFLINGLIVTHAEGSYCQYLMQIGWFGAAWNRIGSLLLQPGAALWQDGIKLLVSAYVAGILFFALLTGLILAVYHPRKKAVPALSHPENTALLEKLALDARDQAYKTQIVTSRVAMVLTIIAAFALFFGYCFVLQDADMVTALLTLFPTKDAATNALLYVLAAYCLIDWVSSLLLLVTRFLYRCDFPYTLIDETATAALLAREEYAGLDGNALAEKAEALREEALNLEKEGGYRPAKERLYQAALLGDVCAMEHYARHCLILHLPDSALYWLDKCIASDTASKEALSMRRRMRFGLRHNVEYLHLSGNLTSAQKWRKSLLSFCGKVLSTLLVLALLTAAALGAAMYFAPEDAEISLPDLLSELFGKETSTETLAAETYPDIAMTLTEQGTQWENCCFRYQEDGSPVVYSYSLSQGGDLSVPDVLAQGESFYSAGVYTGNPWDVRKITQYVSSQENAICIAQDFFTGRSEEECFIILTIHNDDGQPAQERYIPLVLTQ